MTTTPDNPAGPTPDVPEFSETVRVSLVADLAEAPTALRRAVDGLDEAQLNTPYRNWTIRQITHHLADSHLHSYLRFKWTLTEDAPTIKAYEEADWVRTPDCERGDVEPALLLLDGIHAKFVQTIEHMQPEQFDRTFFHPQLNESVSLWTALNYYPWHSRHHTAQILWLREQNGWTVS